MSHRRKMICLFLMMLVIPLNVCAQELSIDTSSPFINPKFDKKISMDFQDVPLVDVLKIFSQQSQMNLVTSEAVAEKRITVYLDNVPVDQALEQILRANSLTFEVQSGTDIYVVKSYTQPDAELVTRFYQLKHASVSAAAINTTLDIESGDETGAPGSESATLLETVKGLLTDKGKVHEDTRTNSLVITDIVSNFPKIESTLAKLDVPVPQILIEVEMLEVAKATADRIGIKAGAAPLVFSGGIREHYYPWNQNELIASGDVEAPVYTAGTIDASGLNATLEFLSTQTDTKNLARPRIMTLNNQTAEIKISTDEAIGLTTSATSVGSAVGTQTDEAERVETGVFLTVTPQANVRTREITMAIIPKVVLARTGATFGTTTFKDPEERASQSLLKVNSGDTIVLGGLIRTETTIITTKVPILGDIPLIGRAFRHNNETISERELITFITPTIIDGAEETVVSTPLPKIILREQDIPQERISAMEQELTTQERIRD